MNVSDSYYTLVQKTVTFMEFAVRTYPEFQYLMVCDDDLYLRVDHLIDVLVAEPQRMVVVLGVARRGALRS